MNRIVDDQITLIPYYRNDDISLLWYQDSEVCKQVDNTDQIYDLTKLHKMYDYKEYQNLQIGRRCISEMIQLAKEQKMVKASAQIYPFNTQSQRMFLALGFQKVDEEWYEYKLI